MNTAKAGTPRNALVLISLAFVAEASGIVLYAKGYYSHSSGSRELGLLAIMIGAFLSMAASAARDRARRALPRDSGGAPTPTAARRSNRPVGIIGAAAVLLGLALFALGPFSWGIRLFGLVVAMAGVAAARTSFDRAPSAGPESGGEGVPRAVRQFDRVMRIIGIALVPLMAFSALALFLTPRTSHEVWTLYTFFVVGLICILVWSYLFARFFVWLALAVGGWSRR